MAASSSASRTVVTSAAYAGSAVLRVWTVRQGVGMQDDLALALRLADAADAVTLPRFRAADLRVTTKPDRSPVTDADTAAEEALRALIAAERPADAVLGEEGGGEVPAPDGSGCSTRSTARRTSPVACPRGRP